MTMPTILVASGTANTGSECVKALSASGAVQVRALVRNPDSDAAKAIAALPNVTLVKGDFDDAASLSAALAGVSRALLVSAPGEDVQYAREVGFLAAAAEAGLEVTVRISTSNYLISKDTTTVYARAHAHIEEYISEHKSKVIDLQPNLFMSNWLIHAAEAKVTGKISVPVKGEHKFAAVDTRDVGAAAAAVLLQPKDKVEELLQVGRFEVNGPELTSFSDHIAALSKACGKELSFNVMEPQAWVQMLVSSGMPELFFQSFAQTLLTYSGELEPSRPFGDQKNSPKLLEIWQPKHTLADWARDNAAAFA